MSSVNKHCILGRVGKTPEKRSFSNGGSVVNFSVATSTSYRDKQSGEKRETTVWHDVACFNEHLGEIIEKYVSKGSRIYIEGQIQKRKWTDRDGNDRWSTETVIPKFGGELVLLDSKSDRQDPPTYSREAVNEARGDAYAEDTEIPF